MILFVSVAPDIFTLFSFGKYLPTHILTYLYQAENNYTELVIPVVGIIALAALFTIIAVKKSKARYGAIIKDLSVTPEVKFIEVLSSADESLKSMFRNRMHCEIPAVLNSDDYQNWNSENCRKLAKDRFNVFIEKCVSASGDNEIIIKNELINMIVDTIPNGEVQRLLGPIYNSH